MENDQNNLLEEFYRRFEIDPESFSTRFTDLSLSSNLRQDILESELKDFQWLSDSVEEVSEVQKKLLERFQVERRNTFSPEVSNVYLRLLIASQDLKELLVEKQIPFYAKRIKSITDELDEINK